MKLGNWTIFGKAKEPILKTETPVSVDNESQPIDKGTVPPGSTKRSSVPDSRQSFELVKGDVSFINPEYVIDMVPVIRKLFQINQNLSLAVNDMVQLTNTGHRIKFDPGVSPDQVDLMRYHLKTASKKWGNHIAGIDGLINKWIAQIYVSGALCNEWVLKKDLSGIENNFLIKPEFIRFSYRRYKGRYDIYQKTDGLSLYDYRPGLPGLKKLNPFTVKYYGLMSDIDAPYGIPPFLAALEDLVTQKSMLKNFSHIMEQMGLLGFLEVLIQKPDMQTGEDETSYAARLNALLLQVKNNVSAGLNDGVSVGFQDDHEYTFHSTTKNMSTLPDIFDLNQRLVANGLKFSPSFLGMGSNAETHINIVFTKMLSQLRNTQLLIKENLEQAYTLELILAGFNFKYLSVEFNKSTITDELKSEQAEEIRVRNVHNKYQMGLISQDQAADELGYEKPDQKEPRGPVDQSAVKKEEREKDKDTSDRRSRDKVKPQPRRGDQDTRKR